MGRWIDRAEGIDGPELEREERQRRLQAENAGSWGGKVSVERRLRRRRRSRPSPSGPRGGLMSYEQLYALWERQNWRAHELDFSVDREHWLVSPAEAQRHTAFSIGSFYVGEERVTADLAPFLLAAPSGEVEAFLATQLVDEMRHAVFFDRWATEVMGLESGSFRARLHEIEDRMLGPWRFLFDDSLRDIADRIKAKPDDLELFVEGIVTYHMVTEGVLAMPGQRIMIEYTARPRPLSGLQQGLPPGRAGRAPPHRLRGPLPEGRLRRAARDEEGDPATGSASCCRRPPRSSARRRPTTPPTSSPTATTPRRSTASPTRR